MRCRVAAALLSVLILAGLSPIALAQDVKYEKYQLDNGMTVILHEDHSLPIATINIWYSVGAKEEPPGRSGFAHLFEHLMFMGTRRVPGSNFDNLMEAGGGNNNANTTLDRTDYYSVGPAKILPTLLWLDADRLEDLGRTMSDEKLGRQRDVVRNEIRQQVENTPYGKAGEYIYRLMYPPGHPYHNAVYGTHEDLEAANVWNVKDFFATYYVPNNASLVVAGDFDPAQVKPLVASLFGSLPRGQNPPHHTAPPVKLGHVERATMLDKVQLPKILMTFHSPAAYAEGDAEMALAGAVLSEGKTSRLYKRLVYDEKTCTSVNAYQDTAALQSMFTIEVLANPDADLSAVERSIDEELARISIDGPTADELKERQATIELSMLASLQSLQTVAARLNEYQYYWNEPNSFKRDLDRYRNATPQSVRDWARKVITPDSRAVIRILPEEPAPAQSARETRPADAAERPFSPPSAQSFTLSSGLPVLLWQRDDLPLVGMTVLLNPHAPLDQPQRAGAAELAAAMIGEGAGDLDALHFSEAMQSLGASFGAGAGKEAATVSLTVLRRNFDKAAALVGDAIRRPRMDAKEWDRVKRIHLEELRQSDEEPTVVASRVAIRALFGARNPYGWPISGTVQTVEPLTLDDIKAEHAALFRPDTSTILIAGNITPADAKAALDKALGEWRPIEGRKTAPPASDLAPAAGDRLRAVIVDRPGAVQTVIRFIMPGAKLNDPRRVQLELLNTLLGGSFTSRLNQNLREQHGYTYGAGSRFVMEPSVGYFIASSSVIADKTGESLKEFLGEFGRLRAKDGQADISPEEASKAAQTLRADTIHEFATIGGLLGEAATLTAAGLPLDTVAQDLAAMKTVSAADLNGLAPRTLDLNHAVLVLVGDKKLILEQIKPLLDSGAIPHPTEFTPTGDPIAPQPESQQ